MEKIALILAGGKGTRLWPLSRENHPKQFIEFRQGASLFQLTIKRTLSIFPASCVFIVSQENYKFTVYNQIELLPGLMSSLKTTLKRNLILEPMAKGTLPTILLAIKYLEARGELYPGMLHIFPSDHIIEPVSRFRDSLKEIGQLAKYDKIATFGVTLGRPQEGYGYIIAGKPIGPGFLVDKFVEKPALKEARRLLDRGAFANAGIFCFKKEVFLGELNLLQPKIFRHYALGWEDFLKRFRDVPAASLDYGIMQKTKKAAVVRLKPKWADLGSWDSFLEFSTRKKGNFNIGKAEFLGTQDCFAYSNNRMVCMVGLRDVLAIDSPDALLLVKKGHSGRVKELVSLLNRKGYLHSKESSTVYRPWGYYTVLHEEKGYKVKEIGIYPKKAISLQRHKYRSEHWNVVKGAVAVFIEGRKAKTLRRSESIFVPQNTKHRVFNATNKTVKIIEVQIGGYLGEDDIQRFTNYG